LATIAAILLPNKGFTYYYLLLIPTAVVVMATGLAQFAPLARSTVVPSRLAASMTARPHANTCWATDANPKQHFPLTRAWQGFMSTAGIIACLAFRIRTPSFLILTLFCLLHG
jgi:hypothetical protein